MQWAKHFCTPVYTNIQQDQKAELDYHMSMLFAYMAGGEGVGVRCFKIEGVRIFSTCFVCVWGGGGQAQYLSFREKNSTPPLLLINDWSL